MDVFQEKTDVVHVRIENPISMRREILNTAVDVARMSQHSYDVRLLRHAEIALIHELKKTSEDIKKIGKKIEKYALPPLPNEGKHQEVHKEIGSYEDDEVSRLKAELKDIEDKLSKL